MDETTISEVMRTMGRKGGRARAARMTAEERSEAARRAAQHPRPSRRKATAPATEPDGASVAT